MLTLGPPQAKFLAAFSHIDRNGNAVRSLYVAFAWYWRGREYSVTIWPV
jgi:hypothetical protein